jgi:bis(5'-nucleosyl)-tetraphosphatase (symmetrical)
MVHAGLSPLWSLKKAKKRAAKVEHILQSDDWQYFCMSLQSKDFAQTEPKDKAERNSFAISVFTRTRFCSDEGMFDWQQKTADAKDHHVKPWFAHEHAKWKKKTKIVFGHWAAKGLVDKESCVLGLDTGCVWGASLSMAKLDCDKPHIYSVACMPSLDTR